jgi:hypothetical protein
MIPRNNAVHASEQNQGIDFGVKRIEEVVAQARPLRFIEAITGYKVAFRLRKNLKLHAP